MHRCTMGMISLKAMATLGKLASSALRHPLMHPEHEMFASVASKYKQQDLPDMYCSFHVPDVNKACERFEKLGVEFVKKPDAGTMKGLAFIKVMCWGS